jgi:hypothetical protein
LGLQELFVSGSLQPKDKDEPLPAVIIKNILQILRFIAAIVLIRMLCPSRSRSMRSARSACRGIAPSFQACVRSISASLDFYVTRLIIDQLVQFLSLKVEKLSLPLLEPFAIVSYHSAVREEVCVDAEHSGSVHVDERCVTPRLCFCARPTIHPVIADFLKHLIEQSFPHLSRSARSSQRRASCLR